MIFRIYDEPQIGKNCYVWLADESFYMHKTTMAFGDAEKVLEDMVKAAE